MSTKENPELKGDVIIEIERELASTERFLEKTYPLLKHPRKALWAGRKAASFEQKAQTLSETVSGKAEEV